MATRAKLLNYAFPMRTTALAAATRNDFAAETLYVPETSSRTFKHVRVDVWARQTDAAATSLTSWLIGIKLGAVAFDDVTITDTITNSGEHTEWHFSRDVTSYFGTNFGAGASQTCQVGVQFGAVGTINIAAELTIVYEYSDTSATTRVKTVQIPLDSNLGLLTTSLVELGTNQIPQLTSGGMLPESSITVRDWYIKIVGNEKAQGGVTDFALGLQIDSDAEFTEGLRESALGSSCSFVSIYSRKSSVPSTTAAHALKARCAAVTSRFHFAVLLVVTYEYDHSASTQIINSVRVPFTPNLNDVVPHANAAGDKHTYSKDVWVEEPGTPTLKQSGLLMSVSPAAGSTNYSQHVAAGAGSDRAYVITRVSEVSCGMGDFLTHRIDSGGAGGAALTLARGRNTLEVDLYHDAAYTSGEIPTLGYLVLYLNYVTDKHADGDGVHSHTIETHLIGAEADAASKEVTVAAFDPPEATWFLMGIGLDLDAISAQAVTRLPWAGEYDSAEGAGSGWQPLGPQYFPGGAELGWTHSTTDSAAAFRLWAGDPRTERMNPETSRLFRLVTLQGSATSYWMSGGRVLCTYHAIKWTKTFTLKDYPSGDGSGLTVTLHRDDDDSTVLVGTTSAGGTVSFTWYDDTIRVWAEGHHGSEPSAYRGRSAAVLMSAS